MLIGCNETEKEGNVEVKPTFELAIDHGVPGHFVLSGKRYGFFYDVADVYVKQFAKELVESHEAGFKGIEKALSEGDLEMALALTSRAVRMKGVYSAPLYSTRYVLLSRRGSNYARMENRTLEEFLAGAKVVIPSAFAESADFSELRLVVPDEKIVIGEEDEFKLAERLSRGEFDILVCEKNEAFAACGLYRNLRRAYELDEHISVSVVTASKKRLDEFMAWYDWYKLTPQFDVTEMFYGEGRGVWADMRSLKSRCTKAVLDGISVYDAEFMAVGEREGVDWRLLSAIAYVESGFTKDAESYRGAKGIMQIMPITAAHFGIDSLTLDLDQNITIAARLLKEMNKIVEFDEHTTPEDRLKILLAAYNCGVGRVMKAMEVIHTDGRNCCSWANVEQCLMDMASMEFVATNNINTGLFRRYQQTLNYVSDVVARYETYCKAIKSDDGVKITGDL